MKNNIYGTEVNDYKLLDTNMILLLSVGAIKELNDKIKNLEKKSIII